MEGRRSTDRTHGPKVRQTGRTGWADMRRERLRRRFPKMAAIAVCVVLPGVSFILWGCGAAVTPAGSGSVAETASTTASAVLPTPTSVLARPEVVTLRAIRQVEAVFGLPVGAVTLSSEPPMLPGSERMLAWDDGGRADLDLDTGRIVSIIPGTVGGTPANFSAMPSSRPPHPTLPLFWAGVAPRLPPKASPPGKPGSSPTATRLPSTPSAGSATTSKERPTRG